MSDILKNGAELEAACEGARAGGWLAVDTEFVWMRTYRAEMGIVQLGLPGGECRILDCRKGTNPGALGAALADEGVEKILHSSRQDLFHLRHYTGAEPRRIFDTQIAAAFAGFPAGAGLQKVLAEALGVNLPKSETRTDWTQRPLTAEQVEYALDDVRYLGELRDALRAKADALGTRAWMEEEMRGLDASGLYADTAPEEAWKRLKGTNRLRGRELAVAKELAAARERLAAELNLPRAWLGDDVSLAELAAKGERVTGMPRFRHRLKDRGALMRAGTAYAAALKKGLATEEGAWPRPAHEELRGEVKAVLAEAMAWMDRRAEEVHVAAGMIASKGALGAFLNDPEGEHELGRGWRWEVAGRELRERWG